ncbi:MAG: chemotaxis response regulator protein-glutamate methylesterase [Clostridiales bacterium]|nr:chemotaxis response regulator protein-glutamate methylesterase [Clostridiales bacterium]
MLSRPAIRVLIVDDSMVFREAIRKCLEKDPLIEVAGTAGDPFEARDKIISLRPDVLTLDIEMPKMNGIEFLRRLMPQYPLPVVVVSSVSGGVFDAINAGAVDFVSKPQLRDPCEIERFHRELAFKIKIASTARVADSRRLRAQRSTSPGRSLRRDIIVAIGASTGGPEALSEVVRGFPADMPAVLIVQHMPPVFTEMFARRLSSSCAMEVREARDREPVRQGIALIAPGGMHMQVAGRGHDRFVRCFEGEKANGHCPSVDVLFHSVASCCGARAVGVILTGMGYDGARGIVAMRKAGARTVGQDRDSSVVYGMPRVAYDLGGVERQVPLGQIAQTVLDMAGEM